MSDEIHEIDAQEGTFQAWHGKTIVRQEIPLNDCWLAKWDVEKRPLYRLKVAGENPLFEQSEFKEITCTDNPNVVIGKPVADSYGVISNADFLKVVEQAMRDIPGSSVETVGSVCKRAKIFVSVKLKELESYRAAGREFRPFLNFLSSHDGSTAFVVNTSNICTVCFNTFTANLFTKTEQKSTVKHTKNALEYLSNVPQLVESWFESNKVFATELDAMARKRVSGAADFDAFFAGLLSVNSEREAEKFNPYAPLSTRKANVVDRLTTLAFKGRGNAGENRADAFSAVTDYYSHESAPNLNRQIESSDFGLGAQIKLRAFNALRDDAAFAAYSRAGQKAIAFV